MTQEGPSYCQEVLAFEIAHASKQLSQDHDLALRISVSSATDAVPTAISYLGNNLHYFDTYSIPTEQPANSTNLQLAKGLAMTYPQVQALSGSAASVCTLWVSDRGNQAFVAPVLVTEAIATLANLTKLHLMVSRGVDGDPTDFQPLAQLSMLQDLALQCCDDYSSCEGVLICNRQTLRKVILTAYAWSASTYRSLPAVAQLAFLSIRIRGLDIAQAHAFGLITAEVFRLSLHGVIGGDELAALNSSRPAVHELTVWKLDQTFSLPQLPSLQRLTFMSREKFSYTGLRTFSNVTQLTLVDQVAICGEGLQHVIKKSLPALEAIALHVTHEYRTGCCFSQHVLNALHSGPHLKVIDLRGVAGLTDKHVTELQGALRNKQARGDVQPRITLLLSRFFNLTVPRRIFSAAEPVLQRKVQSMFLPNLFVRPDSCIVNKIVIGEQ